MVAAVAIAFVENVDIAATVADSDAFDDIGAVRGVVVPEVSATFVGSKKWQC